MSLEDHVIKDLPLSVCVCGHKLDAVVPAMLEEKVRPGEGDMTICSYCGRILIFRKDETLSLVTAEQIVEVLSPMEFMILKKAQLHIKNHLKK
jgi:hypothetical protein